MSILKQRKLKIHIVIHIIFVFAMFEIKGCVKNKNRILVFVNCMNYFFITT